jgi:hypothetical protein
VNGALSKAKADAIVDRIQVRLDGSGVCLACLTFVAFPLDEGDEKNAASWTRRMTPDLWFDGLQEYALNVVRSARDSGVAGADVALVDLEQRGGRSAVARAIVRKLAGQMVEEMRASHASGERFPRNRRAPSGIDAYDARICASCAPPSRWTMTSSP